MDRVNIAIIDDGINADVFENISGVYQRLWVTDNLEIKNEDLDYGRGCVSHGTECASILCRYCNNCNIVSIRILDEKKKDCRIDKLVVALEWCLENSISICSMSLGTEEYQDQFTLKNVIVKLVRRGTIMVASMSNRNRATYPADLIGVLRVKGYETSGKKEISPGKNKLFEPDFWAAGIHQLKSITNETYYVNGNSYAVPVVVAKINELKRQRPKLDITQICRKMNYSSNELKASDSLIGKNRDLNYPNLCSNRYIEKLRKLPFHEIEGPILVAFGKERFKKVNAFIEFMRQNGFYGLAIDNAIGNDKMEGALHLSRWCLSISVLGSLEEYFNVDFIIVCLSKPIEQILSICDLSIDTDDLADEKDSFEKIKRMLEFGDLVYLEDK